MMSHSNIAVFVPHLGCGRQCSFCNQRYITGTTHVPHADDVRLAVETALNSSGYNPENGQIAFFGGSFTAIEREYMLELLKAAKREIDLGNACSIRISTRPDCIDDEILDVLQHYGVRSIELGAQSMCDDVLRLNKRGHDAKAVEDASRLIKQHGFELGLQMMTGLYGDDDEKSIETADKIIALMPDTVRIYPTVVLENTELCRLYKEGKYAPQTVEQAVKLGAGLIMKFEQNGIKVIRFGLHSIDEDKFVAGAWHPALAELCYSQIYLQKALDILKSMPHGNYIIYVGGREISKMCGQHKANLEMLKKMGYNCKIRSFDARTENDMKIVREESLK